MTVSGCAVKHYSKHGFRWEAGCDGVLVRGCVADCSEGDDAWEPQTELLPFGFLVNDGGAPNTGLRFEDCVARNNMKPNQKERYTNGDGFVVEANTQDVTFLRCRALRNQDGGFDLKVPEVRLIDCVAIGHRRDFRIWNGGTLVNCFAGWSTTGIWSRKGGVTATRCTLHEHHGKIAELETGATAPLTLVDCLITATTASSKAEMAGPLIELQNTAVTTSQQPGKDPEYPHATPSWDGTGNAMDSRAYPTQGYRSKR